MAKLTKSAVDRLEANGKRYEVADDTLSGFYIRVNRSGSRTALIRYFADGRPGAYTLGRLGEHFTLAEARTQARKLLGDVARGHDPARERKRRRQAATLAEVAERFMSEHVGPYRKESTARAYKGLLRNHVIPALGSMRCEEIERGDVERLHQRVGRTAPGAANRMIGMLSCLMNKAEVWGYRPSRSNPCLRMPKFKGRKMERFLSGEERARLAEVLQDAEQARKGQPAHVSHGAIMVIRLLELTGARCGEIIGLQWPMVDLERGRLALPDSKTGAKVIPLSPQAVAYLRGLEHARADGGLWVCPGERGGPVHNLERAWRVLRTRAGLEDVRLHDLRHSAASDALAAGLSLPLIGAMLGHKSTQTTQRYAHLADPARQEAARLMGEQIERSAREGAERLREERERAKLAAGESSEGEAGEGAEVAEGAKLTAVALAEGEAGEGAKLAAGAEHGMGAANGGASEGASVIPLGGTVIPFPSRGR